MRTTVASDAIVQEITIKASAERIFEALTNPDQRVKWCTHPPLGASAFNSGISRPCSSKSSSGL